MDDELGDLTPKQEGFCQAYIETGNASEAYRRHYDCEKMKDATVNRAAKQLLDNYKIATRIKELKALNLARHKVTVDYVVATIVSTIERCSQARPVFDPMGRQRNTEGPDGSMVPAYQFDASNVLKGTEQLGKFLKMFTDKMDLSNEDGSLKPPPVMYKVVKK